MSKSKSFGIGCACWIMGILLLLLAGFLFIPEIEVWPYIPLAIGILLLVAGLVFFIDGFISYISPKKE